MAYRRTPQIQARLDAQRGVILDAAAALLAEGGYAACTVAGVADRAGVAAGTVYTHFAGKSELVADVFRAIVTREVAAVRAAADESAPASERTAAVIETFAGRALKAPRRAYALLAEPVEPGVEELRLEFRRAFRDVLAEAVAAGVASGELPPQNPSLVAAALVGAIGEALIGPLAADPDSAASTDTVPMLIAFAHRAIGGHDHAHP